MSRQLERVYPPKLMFLIANPIMRWLLGTSFGARIPDLVLMEFSGRRSGKSYQVVAGVHEINGETAVLTNSPWRHNFAGGHPVTVRRAGTARMAEGVLESSPAKVADVYLSRIRELGVDKGPRRLGIAVHGDGTPTLDELTTLVRDEGLAVIYLTNRES